MSENRRPREVQNQDNVASRLAAFADSYIVYVTDVDAKVRRPVPFTPKHSGPNAGPLNWAHVQKGTVAGQAALKTKALAATDDAAKVAALTSHLNNYTFTNDLGDFGNSELVEATTRIVVELGKAQGVAMKPEKVTRAVKAILNDPSVADKYTDRISAMIATIRSENKPMQSRTRGGTEDTGPDIAV